MDLEKQMTRAAANTNLYSQALAWASDWSQRWFLDPGGNDRLRIGNVDAGWATHVEAYLILLELAIDQLGLSGRRSQPSLTRWLKAQGFDRGIRSAALRRLRASRTREAEVAAVVEIPTPSMLEPICLVIAASDAAGAIAVADPRAATRLAACDRPTHALVLPWREERRLVAEARRSLTAMWRELRSESRPMPCGDIDLAPLASRRLGRLVLRSMPFLAAESAAVERYLEAVRPDVVAIASDQHRIGRLTVAAARRRGIRSVVLQHGLPQAQIGYLPVVADLVAAWSPASRDWFLEAGTQPQSVVVTGNPRIDALAATPRPESKAVHILLALSPTAAATNEALLRGAVEALDRVPRALLTVKLHPGQGDWSFVARIVRGATNRARIAVRRTEPLYPLLAEASVVVVHRSSVAVEALVAHRPVIVHRAGTEANTADLELADLRLRVTEGPSDLAVAATELSKATVARRYLAERRSQIERVAGPLDGRGAERIAALLHHSEDVNADHEGATPSR